jgi:hypothetical protein
MISHFNVNSYVWHCQVDRDRMVGKGMMKRIGGRTGAYFCLGMSSLSAHVVICVQLTCGSGMTLTPGREALLQVCRYGPELYGIVVTS